MFDNIGLGLALNILFWLVVVAIVCVLVFFVLREFSPGIDSRKPKHARGISAHSTAGLTRSARSAVT